LHGATKEVNLKFESLAEAKRYAKECWNGPFSILRTFKYRATFIHPDGDTRVWEFSAFDMERAKATFLVNWGEEIKLLELLEI
jgi:hypothetical protein